MTNEQRNIKLKHLITCMKCEASGKVCDENCLSQYEAGNMGEIIENLEAISEIIEQQPCEDCISRQAVLETIEDCNSDGLKGIFCSYNDGKRFEKYIKELSPVAPKEKTGWIPVSERLPEPNTLVLCYVTTGATETYFLALWNDIQNAWEEGIGGYRFLEHDLEYEVIAWMPLPEPYKVESEVNE